MSTRQLRWFFGLFASLTLAATAYAQAPADPGGALFEQMCVACHTVGGGNRVGPDLAGVTRRRDEAWLERMIREPDRLVAEGDPINRQIVAHRFGAGQRVDHCWSTTWLR